MSSEPDTVKSELSPAAWEMLELLRRFLNARPLRAAYIAQAIGCTDSTNREWRRRQVRGLAQQLRRAGYRVCASDEGYWLARSGVEYAEYLEAVQRKAIFRFVERRQMAAAAEERSSGQMRLFG